jgi:hypothetical protein
LKSHRNSSTELKTQWFSCEPLIKLVSLEGHEDVILERANMRKGRKLVVANTGKVTPLMGYPIYALEGV